MLWLHADEKQNIFKLIFEQVREEDRSKIEEIKSESNEEKTKLDWSWKRSEELIRKTISDAQRKWEKCNRNEGTSSRATGPDKAEIYTQSYLTLAGQPLQNKWKSVL